MKSFYLGIDVSKGYADFVIINYQKEPVIKNFQLDDTFEGHNQLYEVLNRFLSNHPGAVLYAAVESTGGYENNWHNALVNVTYPVEIPDSPFSSLDAPTRERLQNLTFELRAEEKLTTIIAQCTDVVGHALKGYL